VFLLNAIQQGIEEQSRRTRGAEVEPRRRGGAKEQSRSNRGGQEEPRRSQGGEAMETSTVYIFY